MLTSLALLALLQGVVPTTPCIVAPNPHSSSTVESPARLLNPELARGRFAELTVQLGSATRLDSMHARSLGIETVAIPNSPISLSDNHIAFVVDSSGAVVRCSMRLRRPVADSAALFDVAARLRFAPARIAYQRVPQLFVARLVTREDI